MMKLGIGRDLADRREKAQTKEEDGVPGDPKEERSPILGEGGR